MYRHAIHGPAGGRPIPDAAQLTPELAAPTLVTQQAPSPPSTTIVISLTKAKFSRKHVERELGGAGGGRVAEDQNPERERGAGSPTRTDTAVSDARLPAICASVRPARR